MDYGKLVDKQLTNVFKRTKSLMKPITFHLKKNEGFDFGTGKPTSDPLADKPVMGLVVETKQRKESVTMQVLIERIEQLDQYDEATFKGERWKVRDIVLDNGYTQMVELSNG